VVSKTTKAVASRWVRVKKDNHMWDCEAMAVAFGLIKGLIGSTVE